MKRRRRAGSAADRGLIVSGTITLDWIEGTAQPAEAALGGSAIYASAAAAAVGVPVHVVGVVGTDYPMDRLGQLAERGVDLAGIRVEAGQSYHWRARYEGEERETLQAERGVSGSVPPSVPTAWATGGHSVFLGSTDPALQRTVLEQVGSPGWIGLDTMIHWIRDRRDELLELVEDVDVLFLTAAEARLLAEHSSIPHAVELLLEQGPSTVVVKRGPKGAWLMERDGAAAAVPAVAVPEVRDPTGAGDAFAGAFMAALELGDDDPGLTGFRDALRYASAVASFAVEQISVEGFERLSQAELDRRIASLAPNPDPPGNAGPHPDVLSLPREPSPDA